MTEPNKAARSSPDAGLVERDKIVDVLRDNFGWGMKRGLGAIAENIETSADAILALLSHRGANVAVEAAYREIIDNAMVVRHLGIANGNPRNELNQILNWEVAVALDPLVSKDAAALIEQGRTAGRDPATIEAIEDLLHFSDRQLEKNPKMRAAIDTVARALAAPVLTEER